MRKLLKCRVTIFIVLSWVVFSVLGYLGKDGIYKEYAVDVRTTPYFALILDGVKDRIYPWSGWQDAPEFLADEELPESGGGEAGTPAEQLPSTQIPDTQAPVDTQTQTETETVLPPAPKQFIAVDDTYFNDAVFIGDSRTVGLHDYGGLDGATFYATVGLNVYDMWKEKFCEVDGVKMTLEEALVARQFGKVYFQIGINEMGRGTIDTFIQEYAKSVQKFRELQPGAIIYVQGIMRVAKEKSDKDAIFNNPGIQLRNERIAQLGDGQTIFYIDVNEVVCDSTGNLKEELTFDNLHLYGSKYNIWVDFLKTKGIGP